jgi:hypothetical protein
MNISTIPLLIGAILGYIISIYLVVYIIALKFVVLRRLERYYLPPTMKMLSTPIEISYFFVMTTLKNLNIIPIINNFINQNVSNCIINFNIDIPSGLVVYSNYLGISHLLYATFLIYSVFLILCSILFFKYICKWPFKPSIIISLLFFIVTKVLTSLIFTFYSFTVDYIIIPFNALISRINLFQSIILYNNFRYFFAGVLFIPRIGFISAIFKGLFWSLYP